MSRRAAPAPLRAAPSSGPLEAMIATKDAQIQELVEKTRSLETTNARLRDALAQEQGRGSAGVASLHKTFQHERAQWARGCDALQAVHRRAHARTILALDRERAAVLAEREAARLERLARLQRDFRLVAFQRREFDLERRVVDAERELEEQQRAHEEAALALRGELETRRAAVAVRLQETENELAAARSARDASEEALSKLRVEHNSLVAATSGSATDLERTTLLLEGLKSTHAELEAKHADAERTVADLRRQLDKWRTLEGREGAEMDSLRRSRIELEVRVKELEGRAEELEKENKELTKQNGRVATYKKSLEEWKASITGYQEALDEARADAEQAEADAAEAREQLQKAEAELEALRAKGGRAKKRTPAESVAAPPSISDKEADEIPSPPAPQSSKSGPDAASTSQQVNSSDEDAEAVAQPEPPKKKGRPRKKPVEEAAEDAVAKPAAGKKGKRKAQDARGSDDEAPPKKSKKKAKAKDDADDSDEPPKEKAKAPAAAQKKTKPGRKASASTVAAVAAVEEEDEGESVPTPVKKKRKINVFPASQPVSFVWDELPQTGGGLEIPTRLSPVKETDPVPRRSVFGTKGASSYGSFSSLGGRR